MKINRLGDNEDYKTTAFWLYEFGYDLAKNAKEIDYLRDYLNTLQVNKSFNTIDEKIADLRNRVGLDLAIKISNEINKDNISSASKECECKNNTNEKCLCKVKQASMHSEKDVSTMKNILEYIQDMIKNEPHLNAAVVISRCENENGLGFDYLSKKIDQGKLIKYIDSLLDKNKLSGHQNVRYTPAVVDNDYSVEDISAEYYNHAEPSHY